MKKNKEVKRKRDKRIVIRLTESEKEEVYKVASENGMNATDFLLYAIKLIGGRN